MPTQPYKIEVDKSLVDPRLLKIIEDTIPEDKPMRVPGTTTIIGRFKDSGGLIYWAWKEGSEGRDFRETRDAAADAGTLAHLMVEHDIRQLPEPDLSGYAPELVEKASSSFLAYLEWKDQTKLRPLLTEIPLISKRWLFGGTLDAVILNDKVALLDWKTSNAIYQDNIIQLGGGYSILWEESYPDKPVTGGYHMLRFSKEEGDFAHHAWQNLDLAKEQFIYFRLAFEIDKLLKKRL
jgi:hypothetical protein